jgi:hypothetical protein
MPYNGWKNYETWAIGVWIDSYEDSQRAFASMGQLIDKRVKLADAIKDTVLAGVPDIGANMYSDLLEVALEQVDWFELADHFREQGQEGVN